MSRLRIRGYTDRPSVAPGESLSVHISCDDPGTYEAQLVALKNGDPNPDGPGHKETLVDNDANGRYPAVWKRTQAGGFVQVPDPQKKLAPSGSFTVHAFLSAMLPGHGTQCLISRWDEAAQSGWAVQVDEQGCLRLRVGDGTGAVRDVVSDKPLFVDTFYSVTCIYDEGEGTLTLRQTQVVNSTNSRFGLVFPLDGDTSVKADATLHPGEPSVPLVIAGQVEDATSERTWIINNFNGKIDSPSLFSGAASDEEMSSLERGESPQGLRPLARWDFSVGFGKNGIPSDDIVDVSGNECHGFCVNQPDRGMTGWNWEGREEVFKYCPEQYGALWFHDDSLDDARWEKDFDVHIPEGTPSGAYAMRLVQGKNVDWVPFFVRPPRGAATNRVLLLMPTFSYLAYANTQVMQNAATGQAIMGHFTVLEEIDLELNEYTDPYGLSTYDYHRDGRGCQYSSWRRPILNMRPKYTHEFGSVWQYPADLQLIDWLHSQGIDFDIATDHDLQEEGVDLFSRYNVVMTGTHPEYYSRQMIDGWEQYLAQGGRGMYLAGNGMYWIADQHPEKPWMVEIRKGEQGDQAWRARPGELYHGVSGERGGLWRMRGRSSAKVWGTVYTSHCLDVSVGFQQMPDARKPEISWMFEGIDEDEVIGDFGLVNNGAAGLEVDRYDQNLGTPPNALLVASSYSESRNWVLVPEEAYFAYSGMNAPENPLVRGDIVYFSSRNGGAMWSPASMTWCSSLQWNDYDNNVSTMTANVVRYFAQDGPLPEV